MSLGVEHEDGVIDDRLDQLLVSASIEPAGFVAFRHGLSLKVVLAAHTASSPKSAPSIGPQTLMREPCPLDPLRYPRCNVWQTLVTGHCEALNVLLSR